MANAAIGSNKDFHLAQMKENAIPLFDRFFPFQKAVSIQSMALLAALLSGLASANISIPCGTCFSNSSTSTSFFLNGCLFSNIYSATTNGGCICITDWPANLTISLSIFDSCHAASYCGGAVYSFGPKLDVEMVCALECYASDGQFLYINAYNDSAVIKYTSLYHCAPSTSLGGHSGCRLYQSNTTSFETNSSFCNLAWRAAFIQVVLDPNVSISYSNCVNSIAEMQPILWLYEIVNGDITTTNFVNNTSPAIVWSIATCTVIFGKCVFIQNNGTSLIITTGNVLAYGCWIEQSGMTITTGNVTISNCNFASTSALSQNTTRFAESGENCIVPFSIPTASLSFTFGWIEINFPYDLRDILLVTICIYILPVAKVTN